MNKMSNLIEIPPEHLPDWMRQARRGIDWGMLLILAFGLTIAMPFITQGDLPHTNASENYVYRAADYATALLEGRLYPRWSANVFGGYGAPIPHYFPPAPGYTAAAIQVLFTADAVLAGSLKGRLTQHRDICLVEQWRLAAAEPPSRRHHLLVAQAGTDVVGFAALAPASDPDTDAESDAELAAFGVLPDGLPYIVMDYIDGASLAQYLLQHSPQAATFAEYMQKMLPMLAMCCEAIEHAHNAGIVHRDIKPSNILITSTAGGALLPQVPEQDPVVAR